MFLLLVAALMEPTPIDAQAIILRVTEQAARDARIRYEHGLTGTKKQTTRDNEDPAVPSEWHLEMAAGSTLERPTIKDGIAVANTTPCEPQLDITTAMRTRYHLSLASPVPVDGYYIVHFTPAHPDDDATDEEEIVMNHLSGIAYVDKDRWYIRRVHGWLEKPFSRKFVGRVQEATVLLNQELVNGLPVPHDSVFTIRFSRGFGIFLNVTRRISITYEYDPLPAAPAPLSP
jgi:hypothetical protein